MTFRQPHKECQYDNCRTYTAYIRVKQKWTQVGEFCTGCKEFEPIKQEEEELDETSLKRLLDLMDSKEAII